MLKEADSHCKPQKSLKRSAREIQSLINISEQPEISSRDLGTIIVLSHTIALE